MSWLDIVKSGQQGPGAVLLMDFLKNPMIDWSVWGVDASKASAFLENFEKILINETAKEGWHALERAIKQGQLTASCVLDRELALIERLKVLSQSWLNQKNTCAAWRDLLIHTLTELGIYKSLASDSAGAQLLANSAYANTIYLQGVDSWQNSQITYVNTFAQSAYNKANSGASNVVITHSNTVNGIPATNTLLPGELSANLNDGRLYLQLNNGKVIDISSTPAGNTWYVNGNGNDSFVGNTPSAAKKTIAAAVAAANPGDDVIIAGGLYIENTPILVPQNVSITGSGERSCIIQPATASNDIFWVNNNAFITGVKFTNYTGSAVAFPGLIESLTLQAANSTTLTLSSSASSYDNYYNSLQITITSGAASGTIANVTSYSGSTKIAVLDKTLSTVPSAGDSYSVRVPLSLFQSRLDDATYATFLRKNSNKIANNLYDFTNKQGDVSGYHIE